MIRIVKSSGFAICTRPVSQKSSCIFVNCQIIISSWGPSSPVIFSIETCSALIPSWGWKKKIIKDSSTLGIGCPEVLTNQA